MPRLTPGRPASPLPHHGAPLPPADALAAPPPIDGVQWAAQNAFAVFIASGCWAMAHGARPAQAHSTASPDAAHTLTPNPTTRFAALPPHSVLRDSLGPGVSPGKPLDGADLRNDAGCVPGPLRGGPHLRHLLLVRISPERLRPGWLRGACALPVLWAGAKPARPTHGRAASRQRWTLQCRPVPSPHRRHPSTWAPHTLTPCSAA